MQQLTKSDRWMFSASDDSTMMKQIQATHAPDGREFDVTSIIYIIEDIMRHATPSIDAVLNVHIIAPLLASKMFLPVCHD